MSAQPDSISARTAHGAMAPGKTYCSASVAKAAASRMAMSGVSGTRPFTIAEMCLRVTPTASAAAVIETFIGFRYISRRISPGCAGLCIVVLVIVAIIHLHRVSWPEATSPDHRLSGNLILITT